MFLLRFIVTIWHLTADTVRCPCCAGMLYLTFVNYVLFMEVDQINLLNTYLQFKAHSDQYLLSLSCGAVFYIFLVLVFFLLEIKNKVTSFCLSPQFDFLARQWLTASTLLVLFVQKGSAFSLSLQYRMVRSVREK